MTATITWTDALGAGTLGNLVQMPDRFDGWTPNVTMEGERVHALGTGTPYSFEFRADDLVSFRIDNLKGSDLAMARRLKIHLLRSGEVGVNANNELSDLFASATIAPGTEPQISEPTRENREYSFSVTLRSGTGSFVPTSVGRRGGIDYSLFGLLHDWDADALIGLIPDATRPSALLDIVGGVDAVQATSGQRPLFSESGGPNGHAMLEFTRARDDVMKTSVLGSNPALGSTIFLVANFIGFPGGGKHILVNYHSAGIDQVIYKDGLVDGTTIFSASVSGDTLATGTSGWFVLAIVLDPIGGTLTPWYNGVAQTPIGAIYTGWNALKTLWFGWGSAGGGTATGNFQITRKLYMDSYSPAVAEATSALLMAEYGI